MSVGLSSVTLSVWAALSTATTGVGLTAGGGVRRAGLCQPTHYWVPQGRRAGGRIDVLRRGSKYRHPARAVPAGQQERNLPGIVATQPDFPVPVEEGPRPERVARLLRETDEGNVVGVTLVTPFATLDRVPGADFVMKGDGEPLRHALRKKTRCPPGRPWRSRSSTRGRRRATRYARRWWVTGTKAGRACCRCFWKGRAAKRPPAAPMRPIFSGRRRIIPCHRPPAQPDGSSHRSAAGFPIRAPPRSLWQRRRVCPLGRGPNQSRFHAALLAPRQTSRPRRQVSARKPS